MSDAEDIELATLYLAEQICQRAWDTVRELSALSTDSSKFELPLSKLMSARDAFDEARQEVLNV